jgi:hypothetical protein
VSTLKKPRTVSAVPEVASIRKVGKCGVGTMLPRCRLQTRGKHLNNTFKEQIQLWASLNVVKVSKDI